MKTRVLILLTALYFIPGSAAFSQEKKTVNWIDFEQLFESLKTHPKKVFIDFYADWCAPCIKMQKEVFTDPKIIKKLNDEFYAVKMNVESTDTIYFGDQKFINERANRRNPVHQIPLLMARQKNKPFSLPAMVIMDDNFKATARYFQFLNISQLVKILDEKS